MSCVMHAWQKTWPVGLIHYCCNDRKGHGHIPHWMLANWDPTTNGLKQIEHLKRMANVAE